MNITIMAHDKKKELMAQFCTAYQSVLAKHNLSATATTGRLARIAYNEIDMVLMFTDPNSQDPRDNSYVLRTLLLCDAHNVPVATNLATAEMLILGLQRGDLDWRELVHNKR